jgi:hypothetical protein
VKVTLRRPSRLCCRVAVVVCLWVVGTGGRGRRIVLGMYSRSWTRFIGLTIVLRIWSRMAWEMMFRDCQLRRWTAMARVRRRSGLWCFSESGVWFGMAWYAYRVMLATAIASSNQCYQYQSQSQSTITWKLIAENTITLYLARFPSSRDRNTVPYTQRNIKRKKRQIPISYADVYSPEKRR